MQCCNFYYIYFTFYVQFNIVNSCYVFSKYRADLNPERGGSSDTKEPIIFARGKYSHIATHFRLAYKTNHRYVLAHNNLNKTFKISRTHHNSVMHRPIWAYILTEGNDCVWLLCSQLVTAPFYNKLLSNHHVICFVLAAAGTNTEHTSQALKQHQIAVLKIRLAICWET